MWPRHRSETCGWAESGSQHSHTKASGQGAHAGSWGGGLQESRACKQLLASLGCSGAQSAYLPTTHLPLQPVIIISESWSGDSAQNLCFIEGSQNWPLGCRGDLVLGGTQTLLGKGEHEVELVAIALLLCMRVCMYKCMSW